ncbi:internal scaffolding protein [Microviridae sp.]|nr:internal scaffolding protein [Microviridae sp.]
MSTAYSSKHRRVSQKFTAKSMTEQCHLDEVKIQNVVSRARKQGFADHLSQYGGTYGDFCSAPDFHTAQTIIAEARSMFATIPAEIRAQFYNDPAQFLEFMQEPKNREKIEAFGFTTDHLPEVADDQKPANTNSPSSTPKTPPSPPQQPKDFNLSQYTQEDLNALRKQLDASQAT